VADDAPGSAGIDVLTCGHAPNLLEPGRSLDKWIDHVLELGGLTTLDAQVPDGQTPSGLWRSDHAGVVARLSLP
jgi:hypothetical protein